MQLRVLAVAVWLGLAAACLLLLDPLAAALVGAAGCAVLVAVTVTDIERRIVPNRIVVPALAAALAANTLRDPSVEWIIAALGAGAFYLVIALVYPAGLGMGDVKLAAFLGALLGWSVAPALFVGSLLALVPAVAILAVRGSSGRKVKLAFAPYLAAGGVIALFTGDWLLDRWLG